MSILFDMILIYLLLPAAVL